MIHPSSSSRPLRASLPTGGVVLRRLALTAAIVAASWAIGGPSGASAEGDGEVHGNTAPRAPYVIQAGDELSVRFHHSPEFNLDLTVRPDGRVSMPLAREVLAAGRTAEELATEIARQYSSELRDPQVAVIVRTFSLHAVHVGGEVGKPGVVPLTDGLTVLGAVLRAGGLRDTARLKQTLVIRRQDGQAPRVITVDLRRVLKHGDPTHDLLLEPQDVVYLPRTRIADVNRWVNGYFWNLVPVTLRIDTR